MIPIRYLATLFGGALSGVAGAYLAVAYTPMWVEQLTAGRGWIALALVVFATWRPERVLAGAYLFGGVTILQFHAQALGLAVPSQLLSTLPYLATIVVLVVISRDVQKIRVNAPGLAREAVPSGGLRKGDSGSWQRSAAASVSEQRSAVRQRQQSGKMGIAAEYAYAGWLSEDALMRRQRVCLKLTADC